MAGYASLLAFWIGGAANLGGTPPPAPPAGGGMSAGRRGWAREREILELSLQRIQEEDIRKVASVLSQSHRPQAKRIARKLVDYTGDIKQAQSLLRELAKLEAARRERALLTKLQRERDQALTQAIKELRIMLEDEEETAAAVSAAHEQDCRAILSLFCY